MSVANGRVRSEISYRGRCMLANTYTRTVHVERIVDLYAGVHEASVNTTKETLWLLSVEGRVDMQQLAGPAERTAHAREYVGHAAAILPSAHHLADEPQHTARAGDLRTLGRALGGSRIRNAAAPGHRDWGVGLKPKPLPCLPQQKRLRCSTRPPAVISIVRNRDRRPRNLEQFSAGGSE